MSFCPRVFFLLLQIIFVCGNYKYNTFIPTKSPNDNVNYVVRSLKKDLNEIKNEMRTKLEGMKHEINYEIKELRESLVNNQQMKESLAMPPLIVDSNLQGLKRKLKKSFRTVTDQTEEIKKELRSQKAEMYAIRNSVYDSREDIIKKENMMLRNIQNANDSFMCYLSDLRVHLFKINTNLGIIKRDQERIKDLIQMNQHPEVEEVEEHTMEESSTEDTFGHEKYLPGCTTNPLETQETLQTFGMNPPSRHNSTNALPDRKKDRERFSFPDKTQTYKKPVKIKNREKTEVETVFPFTTTDCVDAKKLYLEYPPMPKDCHEAFNFGFMESGVYRIQPPGLEAKEVLCDHHTAAGGWTVILARRQAMKHIHFNKTWMEYEEGFGEPTREYWIGLKTLHALTNNRDHYLRVELEDWEGNTAWASYNHFSVAGPEDKYRLRVAEYSGTAGDSMRHSHLQMFSTIDEDNDQEDWGSCPRGRGGGGWWWGRCACTQPTGQYRKGRYKGPERGITWWHWKDSNYSLKTIVMMIRSKE